jgi:hypothetical protein
MSILRPRKTRPDDPLIVSMSGVRLGQQVLAIVGRDRRLFFDVAARVGLTGRAFGLAADASDAAALGEEAIRHGVAADAGTLDTPWTIAADSIDVAVIDDRDARTPSTAALLPQVKSVLRPGGRVIVVLAAEGGTVARLLGRQRPPDVSGLLDALQGAGFGAGRLVAVRDGLAFVEAARPSARAGGL